MISDAIGSKVFFITKSKKYNIKQMKEMIMGTKKIQILLIDDCETDINEIKAELDNTMKAKFDLIHFNELPGSLDIIKNEKIQVDVILLDLGLVDEHTPKEIFNAVEELVNNIPIIVITGKEDHELALFVINGGASDNMSRGDFASTYGKLRDAITFSLARCAILKDSRKRGDDAVDLKNQMISFVTGEYSCSKENKPE
jgi:response regulator RpfG family c-di-GMP phosphodiesterase